MIVDCHTHVNYISGEIGITEHLTAAETVDVCIVLASANGPGEDVNKKIAEYVDKHKNKLIGFAVFEPSKDKININTLRHTKEKLGFKGIVLYCSACGFHPAHSKAMLFYEMAQELALPIFFHNDSCNYKADAVLEYAQPYLLDDIAREFSNLKIIIGNMGMPFIEQTLSMVAKHKNVYADLTIKPNSLWQTYNIVMSAHERGVMDKLLFGSGFPTCTAGQCIETLLGFNMLLADTNLPTVPRVSIRNIIERDTLELLGIRHKSTESQEDKGEKTKERGVLNKKDKKEDKQS